MQEIPNICKNKREHISINQHLIKSKNSLRLFRYMLQLRSKEKHTIRIIDLCIIHVNNTQTTIKTFIDGWYILPRIIIAAVVGVFCDIFAVSFAPPTQWHISLISIEEWNEEKIVKQNINEILSQTVTVSIMLNGNMHTIHFVNTLVIYHNSTDNKSQKQSRMIIPDSRV